MNTEVLKVGGLNVELVRRAIKNLHLGVYPPDGRVRVAAPPTISDEAVRVAVVSRLGWINRQRAKFLDQARQSARGFVSGETHFHLGQQYRLRVVERKGRAAVRLAGGGRLELSVPQGSSREYREKVFHDWQRAQLKKRGQDLVNDWALRLNVQQPTVGIKRMKTKWGSCSPAANRVWLNLELIKKPPRCIDYLVLHEIAHLIVPDHSEAFVELVNSHMPDWRTRRDELNAAPLAHEYWPSVQAAIN